MREKPTYTFQSFSWRRQVLMVVVMIAVNVCSALDCRYDSSIGRRRNSMAYRQPLKRQYLTHIEWFKSSSDDNIDYDDEGGKNSIQDGTKITVSYEGQSCNIMVLPQESILSALERQSIYIQSQLTTLPESIPSDCRRGNCMTCAALIKHNNNSDIYKDPTIIRSEENGLSPAISKMITKQGYILTCSSFLRSPPPPPTTPQTDNDHHASSSLHLQLGVQHDIWQEIYDHRFTTPETEMIARAAMARVLRQSAERNPKEWIQSTERVLLQQPQTLEHDEPE